MFPLILCKITSEVKTASLNHIKIDKVRAYRGNDSKAKDFQEIALYTYKQQLSEDNERYLLLVGLKE
jgi:hypothetical protein